MGDPIQIIAIGAGVKLLVDLLKLAINPPSWAPPLAAILSGIALAILYRLAAGQILAAQTASAAIIDGITSAGAAMGLTGLHNAARTENMQADRMTRLISDVQAAARAEHTKHEV